MASIKLVSYNLDNCQQSELIVKNIVDLAVSGVNVFCLQEVRPAKSGKFIGDEILEALGGDWQAEFFLTRGHYHDYGLGFIWKKTELSAENFESISFVKLESLQAHEQVFEYVKGDLRAPIQRGAMLGVFKSNGQTVRISNVHLDWHGWSQHRMSQMEQLLAHLKKSPMDREIICGDFNTLGFFGFGRKLKMIEALLGHEFVPSFPNYVTTTTHFQQLDHCFTKKMQPMKAEVVEVSGSDHYPIRVELAFS